MSDNSKIEWTESTWNPVRGCVKVSPGCANCYAETFAERWRGIPGHAYEQGFDLRLVPAKLEEPIHRKKPTTYFVNSMSDLFQEGVSETFIMHVFLTMEKCPQHTFQILTKRADRMRTVVSWLARKWADEGDVFPLPNVWLGVSVENQHFADARIPLLLQTPAAVRFISAEPLLGPIRLKQQRPDGFWPPNAPQPDVAWLRHKDWPDDYQYWSTGLNWVIVGGESGPRARGCNVAWVRSIVEQCQDGHVPVFVKQLGARVIDRNDAGFLGEEPGDWPDVIDIEDRVEHDLDGTRDGYQGAPVRIHLHDRKGGDTEEWPADLRVREFPTVNAAART